MPSKVPIPAFAYGRVESVAGRVGMVKRWMASALLATEKNFRKIMGYRELWALDATSRDTGLCAENLWFPHGVQRDSLHTKINRLSSV